MAKQRSYPGKGITVTYDAARCIHAARCVHGLPAVFDPDRKPWIDLSGADAGEAAEVVMQCPTGALQFERTDGASGEEVPAKTSITTERNGPLYLHGRFSVKQDDGTTLFEDTRIALCRCGASKNKPFCDNSHEAMGFRAGP